MRTIRKDCLRLPVIFVRSTCISAVKEALGRSSCEVIQMDFVRGRHGYSVGRPKAVVSHRAAEADFEGKKSGYRRSRTRIQKLELASYDLAQVLVVKVQCRGNEAHSLMGPV